MALTRFSSQPLQIFLRFFAGKPLTFPRHALALLETFPTDL
jgi:hypothetical protein